MKLSVSFTTLALALTAFAQNGPMINTPVGVQQCSPTLLMVSGGTPPYQIAAIPAGQAGAAPLEVITDGLQGNQFTWNVNLASGTSTTLQVRDSNGNINFSQIITVQANPGNSGCLSSSAGGSSTPAGGSSTTAGGSSTPAGGSSTSGTPATNPSAPTSPSSTPSSLPATAPSTPPTSAAGTTGGAAGTTSSASRTTSGASSGTNTAAAQQTSNAAVGLASGSAAGVVGALLAYVLA